MNAVLGRFSSAPNFVSLGRLSLDLARLVLGPGVQVVNVDVVVFVPVERL